MSLNEPLTRNEGVGSSSLPVGSPRSPRKGSEFAIRCDRAECRGGPRGSRTLATGPWMAQLSLPFSEVGGAELRLRVADQQDGRHSGGEVACGAPQALERFGHARELLARQRCCAE